MQIDSQGLDSIRIFATSLSLALKHAMQIPVHAGKAKTLTRYTSFQIIASQQWQYHTALAMNFTFSSKFRLLSSSIVKSPACYITKIVLYKSVPHGKPSYLSHYSRGWITADSQQQKKQPTTSKTTNNPTHQQTQKQRQTQTKQNTNNNRALSSNILEFYVKHTCETSNAFDKPQHIWHPCVLWVWVGRLDWLLATDWY